MIGLHPLKRKRKTICIDSEISRSATLCVDVGPGGGGGGGLGGGEKGERGADTFQWEKQKIAPPPFAPLLLSLSESTGTLFSLPENRQVEESVPAPGLQPVGYLGENIP